MGWAVGFAEGTNVGLLVGAAEGNMLGVLVGSSVVGNATGENVGLWEGGTIERNKVNDVRIILLNMHTDRMQRCYVPDGLEDGASVEDVGSVD